MRRERNTREVTEIVHEVEFPISHLHEHENLTQRCELKVEGNVS